MNPAKLVVLSALLALAAGCATRETPAPVVDARSSHRPFAAKTYSAVPAPAPKAATVKASQPPILIAPQEFERPPVQVGSIGIIGRVESRPLEALPPPPTRQAPKSEIARMEMQKPAAQAKPVLLAKSDAIAKSDVPTAAASAQFMWPVKGKVLAEFSEPRRKGIDIDGRAGDPIVAAAPGRVTYIGSGIPGMGKLVVIKHDNGFITVYGHNRNILVKEQQAVMQGQRIAELGSTEAERPKLHFQIRKGSAAVDPLLYLPK